MIVVIPAYEPDEKLIGVVEGFRTPDTDYPVIVVDDGSSAPCAPIFAALEKKDGVTVLRHPKNKGKGGALKTAYAYIAEHFPADEGVLTVDADGQHLLRDCLRVIEAYREHPDLLVTGSRRFTGKVPFRSRTGNAITRGMFHLTTGKRVYDTQTGLRAFAAKRIPEMLALKGDRYEYEIHQLLYCCTKSTGVYEVEIETVYLNDNSSSHFNVLKDSAKIYKILFKFLAPTFFKFMTSSFLSFLVDWLAFCLQSERCRSVAPKVAGVCTSPLPPHILLCGKKLTVKMFSFSRDASEEWASTLLAINPVIFIGGGSVARGAALALARVISSIVNYLLNKRFVFGKTGSGASFWKYALCAVTVFGLNWLFIELFTLIGVPALVANPLAQIICYPVSYALQRIFVFQKRKDQ